MSRCSVFTKVMMASQQTIQDTKLFLICPENSSKEQKGLRGFGMRVDNKFTRAYNVLLVAEEKGRGGK